MVVGKRENKTSTKLNGTTAFNITEILLYNREFIFSTGKLPKFQISKLYFKPIFFLIFWVISGGIFITSQPSHPQRLS